MDSIVRQYHGQLMGYLRRRLRNEQDAADAAQETYARMLDYSERQAVTSPSGLLFRIATHVADDKARRDLSHHASDHCAIDDLSLASDEPSQDRRVSAEQELVLIAEVVEALPQKCQQVFLLSRVHHLSYPEIAARCGISVKMVEKHISKALLALRAKVGDAAGETP